MSRDAEELRRKAATAKAGMHAAQQEKAAVDRARELAARKREMNPPPEIVRMREIGKAFVEIVSPTSAGGSKRRIKSHRFPVEGKRLRGWVVGGNRYYEDRLVVLEDSRVGRPDWSVGDWAGSRTRPWQERPWSQELENTLVTWLARNGFT
jgi:hypothetical protein